MASYDKDTYLETVVEQLRCKKACPIIYREIQQHIDDQTEALIMEGMDTSRAVEESVKQMGDPVETGARLDRIHRPKIDPWMIAGILLLSLFGLALQYFISTISAGSDPLSSHQNSVIFSKQIIYTIIGFVFMIIIYYIDYTIIGKYPWLIFSGFWICMLLVIMFRFQTIDGLYYIPGYFLLIIPILGGMIYHMRNKGSAGILICELLFLCSCIMIRLTTNKLIDFIIIAAAFFVMLNFTVYKKWFSVKCLKGLLTIWLPVFLSGSAMVFYFLYNESIIPSYRIMRLKVLLNPSAYADGAGYQLLQAKNAMSGLNYFSMADNIREGTLPNIPSDYAVTYMFRLFGIISGILILFVFFCLIVRIFYTLVKQKNRLGAIIGMGCISVIVVQALIYISTNTGFGLVFSQSYMPFLSYGEGSILTNFILLGLLLSIYRNTNIVTEYSIKRKNKYRIHIEKASD